MAWADRDKVCGFDELHGKVLTAIEGLEKGSQKVTFRCEDGSEYVMTHFQDCCEHVAIEDVIGEVASLIGVPILMAHEASSSGEEAKYESFTWTFYKLATVRGYVDIRWYGVSNGFYSEGVDFYRSKPATIEDSEAAWTRT